MRQQPRASETILEPSCNQSSNPHSDTLTPFFGEGKKEVVFHIDISLSGSVVESQGWGRLLGLPIIEIVFSKHSGKDDVELGICKIDSEICQGETMKPVTLEKMNLPYTFSRSLRKGEKILFETLVSDPSFWPELCRLWEDL